MYLNVKKNFTWRANVFLSLSINASIENIASWWIWMSIESVQTWAKVVRSTWGLYLNRNPICKKISSKTEVETHEAQDGLHNQHWSSDRRAPSSCCKDQTRDHLDKVCLEQYHPHIHNIYRIALCLQKFRHVPDKRNFELKS